MEDINFKKFICYILNCIRKKEKKDEDKYIIIYLNDKKFHQIKYSAAKTAKFNFNDLSNTSYDSVSSVVIYDDLKDKNKDLYNDMFADIENTDTIKSYFNIKQLPKYIIDNSDP